MSPENEARFAEMMARATPEQQALLKAMRQTWEEGREMLSAAVEASPEQRAQRDILRHIREDVMIQATPNRVIPNDPPKPLTAKQMTEGVKDISVLPESHAEWEEAQDLVRRGLGHLTLEQGRALARKEG
jgi:hypothetical protein